MGVIEYHSNNSGGSWWLSDEDWKALDEAGWQVDWYADRADDSGLVSGDRFLGGLASSASKQTDDPNAALAEWERLTGQNAADLGCSCCGPPHSFTYEDGGNSTYLSPSYPSADPTFGGF